jgi:chromosome segregation ATPase
LESRYEQEFRERDAKRQVELNQKLKEYQNLLENLEGLSEQLDKREFVVSKKERELLSKESELDLERVKLARQAEESQKRLEEHVQESAKILKKRVQDAEDNIVLANKERDAYRQKFLELEMKRSEKDVGAMEYQKQIQLLTQANKELEQKCLRLTQSRHELKKKYMGLHDHCQKYKNLLQEQYYKQDDKENKDLNSLKTDVDSLKSKVLDPQVKAEIDRLGREKSLLLQTGYDDNDPLVRDLTAKILSFNI